MFSQKPRQDAPVSDPIGHLGPEALAAYVDGEMDRKSMRRAEYHFARCAECRTEVLAQKGASEWLKRSTDTSQVHASAELLAKLTHLDEAAAQDAHPTQPKPRRSKLSALGALARAFTSHPRPISELRRTKG